jgi:HipA-like C-terminal domain
MRPPNQPVRDQLPAVLARRGPISTTVLAAELGISVATLHRLLPTLGDQLVSSGAARRTRYALRRALRGVAADLPLYAVDESGQARQVGELALLRPEGSRLVDAPGDAPGDGPGGTSGYKPGWPVPDVSRDGWWGGLPYPLYDMRPQGYLGRQFARAEHAALGLPANPEAWSDDDIVWALAQRGADLSGHLILGNPAFERWQAGKLAPPAPIAEADVPAAYVALAEQAVAQGVPGASAAGEFPKFPALRALPGAATPHVLVKFSGTDGSPAVQRWADLLACEHLALQAAAALPGVRSAASRVVQHPGGRTFLEVERFDRHSVFGRSPLVSLGTLNAALLGDGSADWPRLAARLAALTLLMPQDVAAIELLWWFGRLIANSDMHTGNLSFQPHAGRLQLAPAYDMLPMSYAPLPGGEVAPAPGVIPPVPLPLPPQRARWQTACAAALGFWRAAAQDARISPAFQALCARHALVLTDTAARL